MRVPPSLEQTGFLDQPGRLETFIRSLKRIYEQVSLAINGQIGFGDGTNSDNISGVWATVVTPGTPDTNFTVTHKLGRIPVGYIVMGKTAALNVYDGTIAPTTTALTLKATVAAATIDLFIV